MRRAVGIEGMVGAGKTTLFRALVNNGIVGVEEYWEYAQKLGISFPPQPRSVSEAKNNFEFFLGLEKKRRTDLDLVVGPEESTTVILDRTYLTLVAFEAGIRALTEIDIFDWSFERTLEEMNNLIRPDHILFLKLNPKEALERIERAEMETPRVQLSDAFCGGIDYAFNQFNKVWPGLVTYIDASPSKEAVMADAKQRL